jgi:hypothetical protein
MASCSKWSRSEAQKAQSEILAKNKLFVIVKWINPDKNEKPIAVVNRSQIKQSDDQIETNEVVDVKWGKKQDETSVAIVQEYHGSKEQMFRRCKELLKEEGGGTEGSN